MREQSLFLFVILFVTSATFVSQIARSSALEFPEISKPVDEFKVREFLGVSSGSDVSVDKHEAAHQFLSELPKKVLLYRNGCSSVFVSNTGYALTDLHCLNLGLDTRFENPVEKQIVETPSGLKLTYYRSKQELKGTIYPADQLFWFMDRLSRRIDLAEVGGVKLVHMGIGYAVPEDHWNSSVINTAAIQTVSGFSDDYALIKFTNMPSGYTCSDISTALPNENDIVRSSGYPLNAEKRVHKHPQLLLKELKFFDFNSDKANDSVEILTDEIWDHYGLNTDWYGNAVNYESAHFPLYLSIGRYFHSLTSTMKAFPSTYGDIAYLEHIYKPEKYFYSTNMMGGGMSGGPVFDDKGRVIGLNVAMLRNLARVFPKGLSPGTVHISIPYIYKTLLNQHGQEFVDQVFSCP